MLFILLERVTLASTTLERIPPSHVIGSRKKNERSTGL